MTGKFVRIKKILLSKRGETIMEALVSMLILGILLTTIVSVIRFSMALTGNAVNDAAASQEIINDLIHENYPSGNTVELSFQSTTFDIDVRHNVVLYSTDDVTAFSPVTGTGGAP